MTQQLNFSMHSAPKARDVKAWANAQVNGEIVVKALKARNKYQSGATDGFMPRLQRFKICRQLTWGVAPGCCIAHLWC